MKQIAERKRAKYKGRGKSHSFLGLPHYMVKSPEWDALRGNAVKFLIQLAAEYNGSNNGDLSLTKRTALKRGWGGGATRDRAARQCEEAGFVLMTRQGGLHECNLYAITWQPINDLGGKISHAPEIVASHLWKKRVAQTQNEPAKDSL